MNYQKVTPELAARLAEITGPRYVIYADSEKMFPYSHDETFEGGYTSMPEVVVKPRTAAEISRIMQLAVQERIPVTPRGAGSGLSGGAVPLFGGILLSLERMDSILEIDRENLMVVVEPGVITNELNRTLAGEGLFYAGYPLSLESCFIGGNVAENAGGARAVKYGVTGRYVHGLEVVLPGGEILELGGKRLKDVTGYDLLHLLVGSEGTLGIFTRITLRVLPLPPASAVLLAPFPDVESAVKAAPRMMIETGIIPSAIELLDRRSMELCCRFRGEKVPNMETAGSYLLIEVDGALEEVERSYNLLADKCLDGGALDVYVANTPTTREKFWKLRAVIGEALKAYCGENAAEDIVVPPANIPALLAECENLSSRYGLDSVCFGHLGDGNLHIHLLKKEENMPPEKWREAVHAVLSKLYTRARLLGGTLSGEHGIGHKRKKYLPYVMGEAELALMQGIKTVFDPTGILNPGKITGPDPGP
ncbi:MAG: FAD-binding oxidoreductase [Bacillota bacterium]